MSSRVKSRAADMFTESGLGFGTDPVRMREA